MKKILFILMSVSLFTGAFAQDSEATSGGRPSPTATVGPNLLGPIIGLYAGDFNFAIDGSLAWENSIGYWNVKNIPFFGGLVDDDFDFWVAAGSTGPTYYLDSVFQGLFVGAYVNAGYFTIGTSSENVTAMSMGAGAKAGIRWTWDWFSLALGGSYEYNTAFADISSVSGSVEEQLGSIEGVLPEAFVKFEFALY